MTLNINNKNIQLINVKGVNLGKRMSPSVRLIGVDGKEFPQYFAVIEFNTFEALNEYEKEKILEAIENQINKEENEVE